MKKIFLETVYELVLHTKYSFDANATYKHSPPVQHLLLVKVARFEISAVVYLAIIQNRICTGVNWTQTRLWAQRQTHVQPVIQHAPLFPCMRLWRRTAALCPPLIRPSAHTDIKPLKCRETCVSTCGGACAWILVLWIRAAASCNAENGRYSLSVADSSHSLSL